MTVFSNYHQYQENIRINNNMLLWQQQESLFNTIVTKLLN